MSIESTKSGSVRIRITQRSSEVRRRETARETFWAALRDPSRTSDSSTPVPTHLLEGKLCRELGTALHRALVAYISAGIREVERALVRDPDHEFERLFFRFRGPSDGYAGSAYADLMGKWIERRDELFRSSPAIKKAQERLAAAAAVVFSVRIIEYSSLNLDLSIANLQRLAEVFESDVDSFRVFLEAFVPDAFARTFNSDFADELTFEATITESFRKSFKAPDDPEPNVATAGTTSSGRSAAEKPPSEKTSAREKAEFLWKLANGSLLLPVLLALAVMFYAVKELSAIRDKQLGAMAPLLQHHLELLKEDRERLRSSPASSSVVVQPPAAPSSSSTP